MEEKLKADSTGQGSISETSIFTILGIFMYATPTISIGTEKTIPKDRNFFGRKGGILKERNFFKTSDFDCFDIKQ